ncbi:Uracil DNA glycosylase superfamily protein [Pigmentiphaga humi]|uniref:Uracil DNA glycosylase superfamily protein n=1 Tax=Pigmentiphaga humi TaxID=2478468 RepID=A0A3P4B485_9BURK|nr:uracil-DNA glycosylase family protein [Pigmentiphaga humi]VCU70448.1 Uracil DNA glycosylase superfamily protein [Pigmentiphaga humi]
MTLSAEQLEAFRDLAVQLDHTDRAAYAAAGRDPLVPILGLGPADAPLCFFGRDPGAEEVRHGEPFVGSSGQLLRAALHAHLFPGEDYTFDAGLRAGRRCFWISTVPFKPLGNKAWPASVRQRFHPLIARILSCSWQGTHIITLGNEAFEWFGIGLEDQAREAFKAFWRRDDKYTASFSLTLRGPCAARVLHLHPLPHPSPANARWRPHFPRLLQARLDALLPASGTEPS